MKRIFTLLAARILMLIVAAVVLCTISGCVGAYYGSEEQYDEKKGDFYFLAGSRELSHIKEAKSEERIRELAFKKLEGQPVNTDTVNGVTKGYRGVVANLSCCNRYNFHIKGHETKGYVLGPGERKIDYLIQGSYRGIIFNGGDKVGEIEFNVGLQTNTFLGEEYHWYFYAER